MQYWFKCFLVKLNTFDRGIVIVRKFLMSGITEELRDYSSDSDSSGEEKSSSNKVEEHKFDIHPRRPSAMLESDLPKYNTYKCIKVKNGMHRGRCIHFELVLEDRHLFHSKV